MNCPNCENETGNKVTNVLKSASANVRRIECPKCLKAITTIEIYACDVDKKGHGYAAVMRKIQSGEIKVNVDGL